MKKINKNDFLINRVDSIDKLRSLSEQQLKLLTIKIRKDLIKIAQKNKIHLGSNLGIVELSIALLLEINHDTRKIFYDTGHQCYVHKMLTGRYDQIFSIRQEGGLSGFPSRRESKFDFLSSGHASTSLSICQGYNETSQNIKCIPVIGDAAINNGLALEALNDIAYKKNKMVIIVNDNGESISKTIGYLYSQMSKIKKQKWFFFIEKSLWYISNKKNFSRKILYKFFKLFNATEQTIFGKNTFQSLGFMYVGPIDGHNIKEISDAYKRADFYSNYGPTVLHIKTIKSFGYENGDSNSHSLMIGKKEKETFTSVAASHIETHLTQKENIRIINSAMTIPGRYEVIAQKYPEYYQDVGINEEHAISKASGMALNNKKVIIPMYSTFLQRTYDEIHHDIARLKLPVLFLVDRAEIAYQDGDTHHGIYDVGMIKSIPNTILCEPSNDYELRALIDLGISNNTKPFFIRFANLVPFKSPNKIKIKIGDWIKINDINSETVIITYGDSVNKIKVLFSNEVDIINAIFLNNLDESKIFNLLNKYKKIIFYERIFDAGTIYNDVLRIFAINNASCKHIKGLSFKNSEIGHGNLEAINKREYMSMEDLATLVNK